MTRISVLVADGGAGVDERLLTSLLERWALPAGHEVNVGAVGADTLPAARLAAESYADGMVVDVDLVRHQQLPVTSDARPCVYVELSASGWEGPELDGRVLFGRGADTYVWAAKHLAAEVRWRPLQVRYGDHRDQFGELRVPAGPGPHPVVVLIHGGFWRRHWELDLMDQLSIDLADAGFAAWNIEYRRGSGAWQEALDDVAGAVDHLGAISVEHDVDLGRVALVGHSAGGHLALWAAGRRRHGPSADALVHPFLAVPLAPVTNLVECAHRGLGEGAALAFFEAVPQDEPERYRSADPMQRLPLGVPTTVVQGLADGPDLIDLNRRFTALAAALGESVDLVELPGANHFDVIDPSTAAWGAVRDLLVERLRTPREA